MHIVRTSSRGGRGWPKAYAYGVGGGVEKICTYILEGNIKAYRCVQRAG
jgi:hypothetical protein